jgi:hypothetical protein
MPFCQTCGADNAADVRYCTVCGKPVDATVAAAIEAEKAAAAAEAAAAEEEAAAAAAAAKAAPRTENVEPLLAADGLPVGEDLDGAPGGERLLWAGRPIGWFSPILFITRRYRLTNERLQINRGFISRSTEEVDLYRVTDVEVKQNLWGRIFGYGYVTVFAPTNASTGASGGSYRMRDIRKPDYVKDLVRQAARLERQRRRVLLRDEV